MTRDRGSANEAPTHAPGGITSHQLRKLIKKEIRVCPAPNEDDNLMSGFAVEHVDQQKIPTDMAFPKPSPFTHQGMIQPLRRKRPIIGHQ
ncbi:hypothetical protein CDEF62S_00845 [Castellaniella defragrans]